MSKKQTKVKSKASQSPIIDALSQLLADTYSLYLKTQNFHWNVTGPHFFDLHKLFEEQYGALAEAIDLIAERIRALRAPAPATFSQFLKLSSLNEADEGLDADEMVEALLNDHELIASQLTHMFTLMQEEGDEVTLDMLIGRKTEHDKTAWMLRSILGLH